VCHYVDVTPGVAAERSYIPESELAEGLSAPGLALAMVVTRTSFRGRRFGIFQQGKVSVRRCGMRVRSNGISRRRFFKCGNYPADRYSRRERCWAGACGWTRAARHRQSRTAAYDRD
jgi:hypothetical protein